MNIGSNTNLLKINELAKYLNISEVTLRRLIENRKIPFHKIGGGIRFIPKEIQEYLNNNCINPT